MKINIAQIASMGGCVHLPFEPNTPDYPELDWVMVDAALFEEHGVIEHNGKYYHISYPYRDLPEDDEMRRIINHHRCAGRLPDGCTITVDDVALMWGQVSECSHSFTSNANHLHRHNTTEVIQKTNSGFMEVGDGKILPYPPQQEAGAYA